MATIEDKLDALSAQMTSMLQMMEEANAGMCRTLRICTAASRSSMPSSSPAPPASSAPTTTPIPAAPSSSTARTAAAAPTTITMLGAIDEFAVKSPACCNHVPPTKATAAPTTVTTSPTSTNSSDPECSYNDLALLHRATATRSHLIGPDGVPEACWFVSDSGITFIGSGSAHDKHIQEKHAKMVVFVEEDGVSSTMPNRCLMICLTNVQISFSPPFSCSLDALLCAQHRLWPPPWKLRWVSCEAELRPLPWPSFDMVESVAVTSLSVHLWKPPWYVSTQQHTSNEFPELVELCKCLMRPERTTVVLVLSGICLLNSGVMTASVLSKSKLIHLGSCSDGGVSSVHILVHSTITYQPWQPISSGEIDVLLKQPRSPSLLCDLMDSDGLLKSTPWSCLCESVYVVHLQNSSALVLAVSFTAVQKLSVWQEVSGTALGSINILPTSSFRTSKGLYQLKFVRSSKHSHMLLFSFSQYASLSLLLHSSQWCFDQFWKPSWPCQDHVQANCSGSVVQVFLLPLLLKIWLVKKQLRSHNPGDASSSIYLLYYSWLSLREHECVGVNSVMLAPVNYNNYRNGSISYQWLVFVPVMELLQLPCCRTHSSAGKLLVVWANIYAFLLRPEQQWYRQFWKLPRPSPVCRVISWNLLARVSNLQSSGTVVGMLLGLIGMKLMTDCEFATELSLFKLIFVFSEAMTVLQLANHVSENSRISERFLFQKIISIAWGASDMQLSHGIYMVVTLSIFRVGTTTSDFVAKVIFPCVSKVGDLLGVNLIDAKLILHWAQYFKNHIFLFESRIFPWLPLTRALEQNSENPVYGVILLQLSALSHLIVIQHGEFLCTRGPIEKKHPLLNPNTLLARLFNLHGHPILVEYSKEPIVPSHILQPPWEVLRKILVFKSANCMRHGSCYCGEPYHRWLSLRERKGMGGNSVMRQLSVVTCMILSPYVIQISSSMQVLYLCIPTQRYGLLLSESSQVSICVGLPLHLVVFGLTDFHGNEATQSDFLIAWEAIHSECFASPFILPAVPAIQIQASPCQNWKTMKVMCKTLKNSSMLALQFYNLMVEDP